MAAKKKFNFIRPTLYFCIAGIFIPGFSALATFVPLTLFRAFGIECWNAWAGMWAIMTICALATPLMFVRFIKRKLVEGDNLTTRNLLIFNFMEYTFLQCTLSILFTSIKTRCHGTDGQNGLEFAFSAWMAIPFLVLISMVFDNLKENRDEKLRVE